MWWRGFILYNAVGCRYSFTVFCYILCRSGQRHIEKSFQFVPSFRVFLILICSHKEIKILAGSSFDGIVFPIVSCCRRSSSSSNTETPFEVTRGNKNLRFLRVTESNRRCPNISYRIGNVCSFRLRFETWTCEQTHGWRLTRATIRYRVCIRDLRAWR